MKSALADIGDAKRVLRRARLNNPDDADIERAIHHLRMLRRKWIALLRNFEIGKILTSYLARLFCGSSGCPSSLHQLRKSSPASRGYPAFSLCRTPFSFCPSCSSCRCELRAGCRRHSSASTACTRHRRNSTST